MRQDDIRTHFDMQSYGKVVTTANFIAKKTHINVFLLITYAYVTNYSYLCAHKKITSNDLQMEL